MAQSGRIFDIQRFSIDDGPGIRTTFFLQGCNLCCPWCHNPESIRSTPQVMYYQNKCTGCRICTEVCPHGVHRFETGHVLERDRCTGCGACASACPSEALLLRGRQMTPEQVLKEALKDKTFFAVSGGGITFSGGEPMLQPNFLAETLALCQSHKLHTAVDTAGNVPWESFEKILPHTDLVLFDVKADSSEQHRRLTGSDSERIQANLSRLSESSCGLFIRIPLVKGFNFNGPDDPQWRRTLNWLSRLPRMDQLDLLPYHRLGETKHQALGMSCRTGKEQLFSQQELIEMVKQARQLHLPVHCQALTETVGT